MIILDQKRIDAGTLAMLMQRDIHHRLPRARRLLLRLDAGQKLGDYDILWLRSVCEDSRVIRHFVDRNPDYLRIYVRSVSLFSEIVTKALANEQAGG